MLFWNFGLLMVFYSQKHSGCALLTPTAAAKIRPSPSVAPWQPRNLEVKRIGPYRIVIWLYLLGGFKHEFDVPSYEWNPKPIGEVHHFSKWFFNHQPVMNCNLDELSYIYTYIIITYNWMNYSDLTSWRHWNDGWIWWCVGIRGIISRK